MGVESLRAHRLLLEADRLAAAQRPEEALEAARRALALHPRSPGVRLQVAMLHLDRGEAREALELLSQDVPKGNAAWPVFQGLAASDLGDLDKAREFLGEALRMAPENRFARGVKATVWFRAGKPRDAMRTLDRAGIEASPRLLGRLLVEVERTLIALGAGEGSRLRVATYPDPPQRLPSEGGGEAEAAPDTTSPAGTSVTAEVPPTPPAQASSSQVAPDEAPEPSIDDDPPLPWNTASLRSGLLDRIVGAIFDPLYAQRALSRAERHLMAQRPKEALDAALEAVQRYAEIPRGFCILGLAWLNGGRPREALRCLEEAARRDGETPDVLFAQGCCYHEIGDLKNARDHLGKMLAAFAKDAAAHYTLGQIDLEEGKELDARRHFEQAAFLDFLLVRDRMNRLRSALSSAPS